MNSSNAIINFRMHATLLTSIWTVGILLDVFSVLIITLSKKKLIPIEFKILMAQSISLIIFKIIIDSEIILNLVSMRYRKYCLYTILKLAIIASGSYTMLILFYYSLFQASKVSRTRLFVMVYELVHKKKNFTVFQIGIGFLSIFLSIFYYLLAYLDVNQCPNVNFLMKKMIFNGSLITQIVIISLLPIFVYISTAVYIYFSSNRRLLSGNTIIRVRYRKNINVLLKFLALAAIFALGFWLLNAFFIISFIFPDSISYVIIEYTSFVFFSIMYSLLIFIHSITKKTLKMYFFRIFKSR